MPVNIAIIGRPNVGKSTLFNRLTGRRTALVHARPGLTRDRREQQIRIGDLDMRLIDTAGYDDSGEQPLAARMNRQTCTAIGDADLCLFVIDARDGVTALDETIGSLLRRRGARVILLANKCESRAGDAGVIEASALGFGEVAAISAEHGQGIGDVYDLVLAEVEGGLDLTVDADQTAPSDGLALAVIGRPNAGKSTLVNALIGSDRLVTGPEAGLTRDAIDTYWRWQETDIVLIDTAGLRKRSRIQIDTEKLATADAVRAARRADVVALAMDAGMAFEAQDVHLADMVARMGRAIILVATKCDMVTDMRAWRRHAQSCVQRMPAAARSAPLICTSAVGGQGLETLMQAVVDTRQRWSRRIRTSELNTWLSETVKRHPPPAAVGGKPVRPRYISQIRTSPPHLVLIASRGRSLPQSWCRYLTGAMRRDFSFAGVPIRLSVREGRNPYVGKS